MTKDKRRRRKRRGAVIYTPVALLLIVIIAIFGVSVFFRVATIEVTGAEKYSVDQILSVSGIKTGDNLFFIDIKKVERTIRSNLPFLNSVVVEKTMPDTIKITVSESRPLAVVQYDGEWWVVDQSARVLEKTDSLGAAEKIKVSGLTITALGVGEAIVADEGEETKFKYLTDVLYAIENAGIDSDVTMLDVSNIANITFDFKGRITVTMGSGENADSKISWMLSIYDTCTETDVGRIDVSEDGLGRFIPEQ